MDLLTIIGNVSTLLCLGITYVLYGLSAHFFFTASGLLMDRKYNPVLWLSNTYISNSVVTSVVGMLCHLFVLTIESHLFFEAGFILNSSWASPLCKAVGCILWYLAFLGQCSMVLFYIIFMAVTLVQQNQDQFAQIAQTLWIQVAPVFQSTGARLELFVHEGMPRLLLSTRRTGFTEETLEQVMPVQLHATPHEDRLQCAICQDTISAKQLWRRTPCTHTFHAECVDPWFRNHVRCPMCNTIIDET